ncbi:50S ribosomal protein L22 [Candidatus Woesearchaeota archaeon]|nr:50S ribosomal protein L22 [Candidatus Woesearchaeota archaeon]
MKTDMHSAKVVGRNLAISTKHAIVISKYIRGKKLSWAKDKLEKVLDYKAAVPFTVHQKKIGHRKGNMSSGRYPINATKEVIMLLNSAEANALNKGLDTESLVISSIIPNLASRPWHNGRQRRRKMKRTHLEIVLEEKVNEKKKATSKVVKKEAPKVEVKPATKVEAPKEVKTETKQEDKQ